MVAIDPHRFRVVFGHLPTGVTLIAAHGAEGPVGMAANSVTSVSLDPPLVLFCPAKASKTWPKLRAAGAVCINVMAGHHEELTRQFAGPEAERFSGVDYVMRETGPALTDAVAWVECRIRDEHDAGDHTIVVADVVAVDAADAAVPLIFFKGRYGGFHSELQA